jgi:hypothetical protein
MSTLVLSFAMIVIGVALIVQAVSAGGSAISGRLVLGVLFLAAGVGRTYVELRKGRRA